MALPAFLHPFAPPSKERFLNIVRGQGSVVYDDTGKAYIDAMASLWYCNVGYGRREVIEAVTAQQEQLAVYQCFAPFTNPPADALAREIAARAPMPDGRVFFTCSGSESIDTAIKLARIAHERAGEPHRDVVISRTHGYHGVTMGGTSAQGIPANQVGFGPLVPGFVQVPHDDLDAMAQALEAHAGRVAAVISEPVQAAGGVYPPKPGYLEALRELCDRHGAFLVADEVVCGFGRLGTWFGSTYYDVQPDLVTFAKAVNSGYVPLGGVIVGPAVRARLEASPADWMLRHGHTYSGHPTACAAGLACLEVAEREGLLARAPVIGARIHAALEGLVNAGHLASARGAGAVHAAVLPEGRDPFVLRDALLDRGVILRPIGNVLAICPPLVITDHELDVVFGALEEVVRG